MNVFTATGNIGRDAETRFIPNGEPVVSFTVAVKSGYGKSETTTWVQCSLWGKRGEAVAPYLLKGTLVGISGEISLDEYEGKDGTKNKTLKCRLNNVDLLGKKASGDAPAQAPSRSSQGAGPVNAFDDMTDDIPF